MSTKAAPTRKAVVPPAVVTDDMSIFDYLRGCRPPLDKKIIDIACSQAQVPADLREDAAQEIRYMWFTLKPDTSKYRPGQIASYAHRMAIHAALRLRRELGSSVRLPGSAFRKRKDGTSYVTPGVLAAAVDWNELESWFNSEAADSPSIDNEMAEFVDISSFAEEGVGDAPVGEQEPEVAQRLERLEEFRDYLTDRQFGVLTALIEGASYEEIMQEYGIKKGVLMRELSLASAVVGKV